MTDSCIVQLAGYGLVKGLIQTDDLDFVINQLLMVLEKDDFCGDRCRQRKPDCASCCCW